jgi:hypothetical protein
VPAELPPGQVVDATAGEAARAADGCACQGGGGCVWLGSEPCHQPGPSWRLPCSSSIHPWLPPLQVHPDFRLWLTSLPCEHVPPAVLQAAVKVAVEPPMGVRATLLRAYQGLEPGALDACPGVPSEWRRLVFACSLFHAGELCMLLSSACMLLLEVDFHPQASSAPAGLQHECWAWICLAAAGAGRAHSLQTRAAASPCQPAD